MAAPRKAWEVSTSLRLDNSSRRRETTTQNMLGEREETSKEAAKKKVRTMVKESFLVITLRKADKSSRLDGDLGFTETKRKSAHREKSKKGGAATSRTTAP